MDECSQTRTRPPVIIGGAPRHLLTKSTFRSTKLFQMIGASLVLRSALQRSSSSDRYFQIMSNWFEQIAVDVNDWKSVPIKMHKMLFRGELKTEATF